VSQGRITASIDAADATEEKLMTALVKKTKPAA
jgi:hypothetical protein